MRRRSLKRDLGGALTAGVLALAGLGCQSAGERVEKMFLTEYRALSFDRPADLIPPDGLRVTSTEDRQIALAWEPVLVGDVAGYAVLRARGPASEHRLIGSTESRFASVYIDAGTAPAGLGDGQTYSYRVHPFDSLGRVSRSHGHITATTDPRPTAPDGLRSYSNLPRKVALAWDPSSDRSVVGYNVYRSPTLSGQWARIGFANGRLNTVWEDPVNGDLRVMYYRIEAVNRFGAASDPTGGVRAVTKAEPLPPIGLEVRTRELGSIELGWRENVEPDLTRYEIWRADAAADGDASFGTERRIGEVAPPATSFTDYGVGCGQRVRYRMRVMDGDRLVSGFSEPLEGRGGTMGLRLERDAAGRPVLAWDWDAELQARWPAARISEGRTALPDRVLDTAPNTGRYSLADLAPGSYRFAVTLLDPTAGSPGSAEPGPAGSSGDATAPAVSGSGPRPRQSPTCGIELEIPSTTP